MNCWVFILRGQQGVHYCHHHQKYIYLHTDITVRDQGSIPSRVIPKTKKMVFDASLLNTQHYNAGIKSKWSNPRKGVAPPPAPRCSSNWKNSIRVVLYYGRQIYLLVCVLAYDYINCLKLIMQRNIHKVNTGL